MPVAEQLIASFVTDAISFVIQGESCRFRREKFLMRQPNTLSRMGLRIGQESLRNAHSRRQREYAGWALMAEGLVVDAEKRLSGIERHSRHEHANHLDSLGCRVTLSVLAVEWILSRTAPLGLPKLGVPRHRCVSRHPAHAFRQ